MEESVHTGKKPVGKIKLTNTVPLAVRDDRPLIYQNPDVELDDLRPEVFFESDRIVLPSLLHVYLLHFRISRDDGRDVREPLQRGSVLLGATQHEL